MGPIIEAAKIGPLIVQPDIVKFSTREGGDRVVRSYVSDESLFNPSYYEYSVFVVPDMVFNGVEKLHVFHGDVDDRLSPTYIVIEREEGVYMLVVTEQSFEVYRYEDNSNSQHEGGHGNSRYHLVGSSDDDGSIIMSILGINTESFFPSIERVLSEEDKVYQRIGSKHLPKSGMLGVSIGSLSVGYGIKDDIPSSVAVWNPLNDGVIRITYELTLYPSSINFGAIRVSSLNGLMYPLIAFRVDSRDGQQVNHFLYFQRDGRYVPLNNFDVMVENNRRWD